MIQWYFLAENESKTYLQYEEETETREDKTKNPSNRINAVVHSVLCHVSRTGPTMVRDVVRGSTTEYNKRRKKKERKRESERKNHFRDTLVKEEDQLNLERKRKSQN